MGKVIYSNNAGKVKIPTSVVFPDATEQPSAPNMGCAHMYVTATAPTTITVADTYYKMAGTTAADICADFTHSNNRLTYNLALTRRFLVNIAFSISSSEKDLIASFEIHKNGTEIIASRIKRTLRSVDDIYIMAISSMVEISQNDYVELWATSDTAGVELTLQDMGFTLCG